MIPAIAISNEENKNSAGTCTDTCADSKYMAGKSYEQKNLPMKAAMMYWTAMKEGSKKAKEVFLFDMDDKKKTNISFIRFEIIRYAAEIGCPEAQFSLGARYRTGVGVAKSYDLAFKWFALSAEQGNLDAIFYLGKMYDKGRSVGQDKTIAMK